MKVWLFSRENSRIFSKGIGFCAAAPGYAYPGRLFDSYYFSIKWLTPFYPALIAQAATGGEKCMDYVF
ncbi:MAG: hypothetical protein MR762_06520 [Clostridiales bacterium]|nr:hypothetical protein [Clostridiales bacterium]